MRGTDGNDSLDGTNGHDVIHGAAGDDTIHGAGGKDLLRGGKGADLIYGDGGDDVLNGDQGNDQLWGGNGDDVLYGGNGHDTLDGGLGHDVIIAGVHDSVLDSDGCTIVFGVDGHNKHVHDTRGYVGILDATGAHENVEFNWSALAAIGITEDDITVKDNIIHIHGVGDHGEKVNIEVDVAADAHLTLTDGHSASADGLVL